MPIVLRHDGYKFFFYSNENDPIEPCHIHVRKGENLAKYWIIPFISLAESYGFNSPELNEIQKFIEENKKTFKEKWNEYFGIK